MDVLTHHRKIRKLIVCDSIELFPSDRREEKQTEDCQLHINKLLGINNDTFLKYFKMDEKPSVAELSESQKKINEVLGISPELFKKYNH